MSQTLLPQLKYQVTDQIVDTKSLLDETNFYHQGQGAPVELTKKLTYILGDYNRNYPISMMTLGGNGFGNGLENGSAIELDDVQFTYPVMGRKNKASVVYSTEYSSGDKPGIGHGTFYITFHDNWIKRFYKLQSQSGTQAYVHADGEPVAGGYRYACTLDPAGASDFCPLADLEPGAKWVDLFTQVAESESRSTESKMVLPGSFKNQMGFMRAGMSWAGNAANKIMKISVGRGDGKQTEVWMDYAMWQFEERWLEECEHYYWYSRYNRHADGTIPLKDFITGKVIPTGSGILEQITNKSTYTELTHNSLSNKVGDALFGMGRKGLNVTLMTGTGGIREFDRAMKASGAQFIANGNIADKFVTGTGNALKLGGFFDGFYHIDGYTITIKHNPVFDEGRVAQVSPLHPKSGLPLESYRMVFLDTKDVDGQPNIRHVAQKGRSYLDGVVKGLTPMPRSLSILVGNSGGQASKDLASVQDKSEYTRFKSAGIQIMRANCCFDLQCVAGL